MLSGTGLVQGRESVLDSSGASAAEPEASVAAVQRYLPLEMESVPDASAAAVEPVPEAAAVQRYLPLEMESVPDALAAAVEPVQGEVWSAAD